MNIFVLDKDPVSSARAMCDKHVVKMILESCQMLSTALQIKTGHIPPFAYKPTHKNHPCSVWARETNANFQWLTRHAKALIREYDKRYGKPNTFLKAREIVQYCECTEIDSNNVLTPFVQAMPDQYKHSDAVVAYRSYYRNEKKGFAVWRNETPEWWE